jgi:2-polyprenyl-3-methyl-5-hydroxy-6-metoxy-1,4-benzoquinol methylase
MDIEKMQQRKQATIAQFGEWTAHNIHLHNDVYTIGNRVVGDEVKLRRITQMVADVAKKPLNELRVLDLACLEGLYGIELARQGAQVVGIEGRETNLAKAQFTKEILALDNLTLIQDDVRNLSVEQQGSFDVVLCLGILYHLEVPDLFLFLERLSQVCQGFVVIDTHVGATPERSHVYNGHTYWGTSYQEHTPQSSLDERSQDLWASLDNVTSFWFTRPSLYNVLSHLGFTTIYECYYPTEIDKQPDRLTFLAIKGQSQALQSAPLMAHQPIPDLAEQPVSEAQPTPAQPPAQSPLPLAAESFPGRAIARRIKTLFMG